MTEAKAPFAIPTTAQRSAEEDVTTTLYRAAIGPVNPAYYLPIFARFEAADRAGLSWNHAASLLTFNWLVYRQLWGAALAYAGLVAAVGLLVFGIGRLVFQMSDTLTMALALGFGLAAFVLPGLLGNALFQKECRKRMAKALADHAVLADACVSLQRQSSSRLRALWVAMANIAVLGIAVFIYLQISALSTLAVLPQGALEPGHVASGLATEASSPLAGASMASATPAAAAASAPMAAASLPLAATPVAAIASAPVSAPLAVVTAAPASAPIPEPVVVTPPAPAAAQETAKAEPKTASKAAAPATPTAPEASKPASKASLAKATPAPAAPAMHEALFYINVGLFSKPRNAARVHAQLLEAQLPSVMKELKTSKDRQIRVRVGPFATEEQAEAAAEKIRSLKFDTGIIQQ